MTTNKITSQGTIKVVNPDTNGTIRKNEIRTYINVSQLNGEVKKVYVRVLGEKYGKVLVEALEGYPFVPTFATNLTKNLGYENGRQMSNRWLGYQSFINLESDEKHPADEAKTHECENCQEGTATRDHIYEACDCCNGNWQDCPNCSQEGTGGQDVPDLLASMR